MTVVERIPPPITDDERVEMVLLYVNKKMSILQVATATSRSASSVWKVLDAEGVPRRRPGRQPGTPAAPHAPRNGRNLTLDDKAQIVSRYVSGDSMAEVAAATRRGVGTVSRVLEEADVPRRRPGPRTRHFCGTVARHVPHVGCNGFGYAAGPKEGLCPREDPHTPHLSCDGRGAGK